MIHYIKGTIEAKFENGIVVETGGIGYEVFVPVGSSLYLAKQGTDVQVFISMIVKEDDVSLYGFPSESSLNLFKKLITVNSVGAKAAMAILSAVSDEQLKKAILFDDVDTITTAKGVGKKMAQKIVLELKDKLDKTELSAAGFESGEVIIPEGDSRAEAVDALVSLGYSRSEATEALIGIKEKDLTAEDYIKLALKKI
jgi:Holliday junction DNA helicase, RuvA subunit